MIDPTKFLPDRELLNVASRFMSDLMAVEYHREAPNQPTVERLDTMAEISYRAAFALLRRHAELTKNMSDQKGKKK